MGYMKYRSQSTQLAAFWALFQLISKVQKGRNGLLGILSFPCNHNNGCIWTVPTGYPNMIKSINEEQSAQNLLTSWCFFTVTGSWTPNRTVLILFQFVLGIKQNLASHKRWKWVKECRDLPLSHFVVPHWENISAKIKNLNPIT